MPQFWAVLECPQEHTVFLIMIDMDTIENDVLVFFEKALGRKLKIFSSLADFCKNEDDAYYLFLEFFENFKIEKGSLDLDKFFYARANFWDIIRFKKVRQDEKQKITIEHLIKVAEKKEWFDPPLPQESFLDTRD